MEHFFCWIFSCNPIFNISNDSNFGGPVNDNVFPHQARFSLFKISLGINKIYIFTYKEFHFKTIYRLNLRELNYGRHATEEIDKNYYEEVKRLEQLKNGQKKLFAARVEEEKEFLTYLIENEKERVTNSYSKLNLYTAIYLVLIPILVIPMKDDILRIINRIVSFVDRTTSITKYINDIGPVNAIINILILLLYIAIIHFAFNSGVFIFNTMRVGGVNKTKYSSVKNDLSEFRLNKAYYFDWQNQSNYSTYIVSLIKNIEEQMLLFLLMVGLLKIIEIFL